MFGELSYQYSNVLETLRKSSIISISQLEICQASLDSNFLQPCNSRHMAACLVTYPGSIAMHCNIFMRTLSFVFCPGCEDGAIHYHYQGRISLCFLQPSAQLPSVCEVDATPGVETAVLLLLTIQG